jgi:hypothetical protein
MGVSNTRSLGVVWDDVKYGGAARKVTLGVQCALMWLQLECFEHQPV